MINYYNFFWTISEVRNENKNKRNLRSAKSRHLFATILI